jgi:hypothetical protein
MAPRNDDEDDFGETQPIRPIRHDRSGAHRSVTPTDIEAIAQAQAEAQAKVNASIDRAKQVRDLELTAAEWFGRDGKGGRLESMATDLAKHEAQLDRHEGVLNALTEFKGRILWLGGLALTIGGGLAALAFELIKHVWG